MPAHAHLDKNMKIPTTNKRTRKSVHLTLERYDQLVRMSHKFATTRADLIDRVLASAFENKEFLKTI